MYTSAAEKIAKAFANHEKCRASHAVCTGSEVSYRGNVIMKYMPDTKRFLVSLAGWDTVTTRRYLDAICRALDPRNGAVRAAVGRSRGVTYLQRDGAREMMFTDRFYPVPHKPAA